MRQLSLALDLLGHGGGFLRNLVHTPHHVESLLWILVERASEEALETTDDVGEGDELAGLASEDLGNVERLREEAFDLARACDSELVLLGELIHTQDGNDILQGLVILEHLLD